MLSVGHQLVAFVLDFTVHWMPLHGRIYHILFWSRAAGGREACRAIHAELRVDREMCSEGRVKAAAKPLSLCI